jgi:hypothetical protein
MTAMGSAVADNRQHMEIGMTERKNHSPGTRLATDIARCMRN